MDKNILEQYIELKGEIQDLKDRIDKDERRLAKIEKEGVVSDNVLGIFEGIITFLTGVFQGDWEKAWTGIVQAVGSIFGTL